MREADVMILACVTIIAVAAGGELVYFALSSMTGPALWAGLFFCLGIISGRLLWP